MGGGGGGGWNTLGDIRSLEQKAKEVLQGGKRNVFISFSTDDINEVNLLRAQTKNENSDIEFNDHSVRVPYKSERAEYIKQKITERIRRASVTVVYLSPNSIASKWVKWEVKKSIELGKRVIAVHPANGKPAKMPPWLSGKDIRTTTWAKLPDALE